MNGNLKVILLKNKMVMKIGDIVKYGGEAHLIVNIIDGSPVVVPRSVIDDECYIVGLDELE
jgi:hypothetical protein